MTGAEMEALIARVEAATGPDRELDEAIEKVVIPSVKDLTRAEGGRFHPVYGRVSEPAFYTASLDAAASLVPSGWQWEIYSNGSALLFVQPPEPWAIRRTASALRCATPALALCLAVLRALLPQESDDHV